MASSSLLAAFRILAVALTLLATCAAAQETGTAATGATPGGVFLNAQRLLQFTDEVRTAPGKDLHGNLVTTTTDVWKLRGDVSLPLNAQWSLVLRGDLPFLAKDKYARSNPDGHFLYGIGDADLQAALVGDLDARWKVGGGARLIAPTGDPEITSRVWRIMPIVSARYAAPEISAGSYFELETRYDVGIDGPATAKFVSNLQIAPTINVSLPDRWFVTLYPDPQIRWNFGAPITGETGRLFLPFDARIGRRFSDAFTASLEVGFPIVKQYPVYTFMTALRLNLNF